MDLVGHVIERGASGTDAIYLLNWEQFSFYWLQIEERLDKTDFGSFYTKEWLKKSVAEGSVHVWVLSDGVIRLVVFSQLVAYPRGLTIQLFWGYGTGLDQFLDRGNTLMDKVAEVMKAEWIEIVGRKGWVRRMKRYGFETETYIISRPAGKIRSH